MAYEGIIAPIPIGDGGLDARNNKSAVPINKLVKANNVFIKKSLVGKEGGSSHANASAISGSPSIVGGTEYFPNSTTQRSVIATSDGKLFKDNPLYTFGVTLKSGLGIDKKTVMTEGGAEASGNPKKLFIFNGNDPVQVLSGDGSSTTDLATPPADWTGTTQPIKGVMHNNRLWAILGHNLYGSTVTDHEDFTSAGSQLFAIYPGDGIELTNMVSIFGRLYLFKQPYGIYYLDDADFDSANWIVKKVTGKIGCSGVDALDYSQNEAVFVSKDGGVHFLSGADTFGDVKDSDIMAILNLERLVQTDLNRNRLDRAVIRYYEDKKEVWVCYTSSGSSLNNSIIKLEISDLSNIKASFSQKDECESLWMAMDSTTNVRKPVSGGHSGFVWLLDESNRNVNGISYQAGFQTPFTGFEYIDEKLEVRNKIFDYLEVHAVPVGDHDLTVDVYIDGNYIETITFNMGTSGSALDAFELDVDRLDGAGVVNKIAMLHGFGRRISFDCYNTGLNESFEIEKMFCAFRVGDESLRD